MKSFVITIEGMPASESAALNCKQSAKQFGIDVETFSAFVPNTVLSILSSDSLEPNVLLGTPDWRTDIIQRTEEFPPHICCYMSHYALWKRCVELDESILIFEHDAVMLASIPVVEFEHIFNLGNDILRPFTYTDQQSIGMISGRIYGAQGYIITPAGASNLISYTQLSGYTTTDKVINSDIVDIIQMKPGICYQNREFSTLQAKLGAEQLWDDFNA